MQIKMDFKNSPKGPFPELPRSEQLPNVIHVMTYYNGTLLYNHRYNPAHERVPMTMTVAICNQKICRETSAFQIHMRNDHICGSTVEKYTDLVNRNTKD